MSANHTTYPPDPYAPLEHTLVHLDGLRLCAETVLNEAPPNALQGNLSALFALIDAQRLMILQGFEQVQALHEGGEV